MLAALLLLGLVAVSGLVSDGGMVLAERRSLQNAADAAASAGAMQLDVAAYRRSGGRVTLDRAAALSAASAVASSAGLSARVEASPGRVSVEVERLVEPVFLRLLGLGPVTVRALARAEPRSGVASVR